MHAWAGRGMEVTSSEREKHKEQDRMGGTGRECGKLSPKLAQWSAVDLDKRACVALSHPSSWCR